jgi:poly-gamma-glutamate capsule biosynthesis protein CapA/YwtB (metallophosphatase superfamily)
MVSAVVSLPFQPLSAQPRPQPATVRERAAAGYFRDIALWLNQPLAPHDIFVQVQADRPGCLRLVVEFRQPPIQDHLLRLLCHRIWLLNSDLIEGIVVVARPLGHRQVVWQRRIKITTPALKQRQMRLVAPSRLQLSASPMPPRIKVSRRAKRLSRQRLQTLRTFVLTGSAVAAFVMGCLLEVALSGPTPSLPQFSAQSEGSPSPRGGVRPEGSYQAQAEMAGTTVSTVAVERTGPSAHRPTVVDTALEPVGVINHQKTTPVPSDYVTLLFGGDISLEDISPDTLNAPGGFFADVAEYGQADLALVNLATPLTTAATNLQEEFRRQTRPEAVDLLVNSGVDIVNLTHSRLMDYGTSGLDETLTTLDSKGLYRIGAGRNAMEARRPEILDVKGKRIAYLSYAMGGNNAAHDTTVLKERAGTENQAIAKEVERFKTATAFKDRAGFNAQGMPEIVADIQALRPEVDWIVVNFRWVDHLTEQPNFMQTNLARLAIDQGADVVVGYHPTVIQGGEIYKGRPIAYSLGDFVFRPDEPLENQDSAVLKVALKEDQMRVELVPVRVRDSLPKTLTGKSSQEVLQRIEQASSQFDKPLTSPVLLDLKTPQLAPDIQGDPSSPFVTPESEEVLPVELEPTDQFPRKEMILETAPEAPQEAPPTLLQPDLEIEFDEDLPDWGPKVSPEQRQFQPVPPQRSGGNTEPQQLGASPTAEIPVPVPSPRLWGEPLAFEGGPTQAPEAKIPEAKIPEVKIPEVKLTRVPPLPEMAAIAVPPAVDWADTVPLTPIDSRAID